MVYPCVSRYYPTKLQPHIYVLYLVCCIITGTHSSTSKMGWDSKFQQDSKLSAEDSFFRWNDQLDQLAFCRFHWHRICCPFQFLLEQSDNQHFFFSWNDQLLIFQRKGVGRENLTKIWAPQNQEMNLGFWVFFGMHLQEISWWNQEIHMILWDPRNLEALIPLHKLKFLAGFHQQLSYCMSSDGPSSGGTGGLGQFGGKLLKSTGGKLQWLDVPTFHPFSILIPTKRDCPVFQTLLGCFPNFHRQRSWLFPSPQKNVGCIRCLWKCVHLSKLV